MSDIDQDQFIARISYAVVAQIAPQELSSFSIISEAYFKNPRKMRAGLQGKEEMLSFGMEAVSTILMSPFVLTIVNDVLQALAQEVASSGIIMKILQRLHLVKKKKRKISTPLSQAQLQRVRQLTLVEARQFKLSKEQAELLANALVGRLALDSAS